ncbi:SH3 domain-containing protein 21 [Conger conger]|uniref:SH3 domain-containing protein 21 n=1 Tax=Conger conger TaxID=82655 RepID=UPI002A59ABCD|nr:SH3 domain-containing protein 21 [Conger conger]
MEVLVLVDFQGSLKDELEVHVGDVVKNVTKATEEGWLEGELRGKRGIFPANFVKEVPVYLIGDSKREPRSIRKSRMPKQQTRKCEVAFAYSSQNGDELDLVVGETIDIIKEIEDGWWLGSKNAKVGVFPSNFVKEIYITPKDAKLNEGKSRPKLSDDLFSKENKPAQRASVRKKIANVKECCQVMFDYTGVAEDELSMKKGEIITIISKDSEDEGWWEGEVNGRRGFFPDNFVMVIPTDALQSLNRSQPPVRHDAPPAAKVETSPPALKEEKMDSKDLRSDPPGKLMLPGMRKAPPPPVKDKPPKFVPNKSNGEVSPLSPKQEKDSEQLDVVEVSTERLTHPTANRAKPPQRRPPTGQVTSPEAAEDSSLSPTPTGQPGLGPKQPAPPKPSPPQSPAAPSLDEPDLTPSAPQNHDQDQDRLRAEVRELSMALELLKNRQLRDMEDVREELNQERAKRIALQEEMELLKKSFNNH